MKKKFYISLAFTAILLFYSFYSSPLSDTTIINKNIPNIYPNINISCDSFPQNEPSVKISRKNPDRVVAAWRDFRTGVNPALRRIGYSYSKDGGMTWSASVLLQPFNSHFIFASDPAVCVDTAGNFYISAISINADRTNSIVTVYKSTNEGVTFDKSFNIASHADTSIFGDDKDYITCDMVKGSPYINTLYVTLTSDSGCVLLKSSDEGNTWSNRINITPNNKGYGVVPAVGINGELYTLWVGSLNDKEYGLHTSISTNSGSSFTSKFICPMSKSTSFIRFPSIAVDISESARKGFVYAVWSDEAPEGDEDIYFSASSDKGKTWSKPVMVNNDSLLNKNQYWPCITVDSYGNIFIIFYDTRNTNSNNEIEAYLVRSADGGNTFKNELLSSVPSLVKTPNFDVRYGDYIGIDSWQNKIIPVWTDQRAGRYNMEIYSSVFFDTIPPAPPIAAEIPERLYLYIDYNVNSASSKTIKFNIPVNTYTNVSIYDLFGSEVTVLENENLKDGVQQFKWNAASFANGIYYYRINFGMIIQTGKLLLLK